LNIIAYLLFICVGLRWGLLPTFGGMCLLP